ncbi:entericidin A/B family lipoprotein [[Enterobacter] lignolyticus]|uniref:Entericidin EcnAB n=1 Tax=Enterobacter lignolyticus (strain SCF1) TaxID=701347 RepID=E3G1F8_ENTLS|nr:entericidin A/B family lipoprotein [[Enterobacter] lignolyticus]ADO50243.1 Entericidin EcnAB [[Enterobacter] lignolyticus SCF1]
MNRLLKLLVVFFIASLALSGCNTFRGFGEDVKHLGNSISHAAG